MPGVKKPETLTLFYSFVNIVNHIASFQLLNQEKSCYETMDEVFCHVFSIALNSDVNVFEPSDE
jgi:hypothetical protein